VGRAADRADPDCGAARCRRGCRPMKVVIFCGGFGVRMGEATQRIPKPMITIGGRPILWHIMRYYASWGHTEFILCLGYRAEVVKEYFLSYKEALSNDFVFSRGGKDLTLLSTDIDEWKITFVDTGIRSTIGDRLRLVRSFIEDDEMFLATYGDGVTDLPLDEMVESFRAGGRTAAFIAVRPNTNTHVVQMNGDGEVTGIDDIADAGVFINGGFFAFRREIFDVVNPGEELVEEPFRRLIAARALGAYRYEGFWAPMDTLKDKQDLDTLWESGDAPWARRRT
jgi:glucose-1-phosphate cytidylyltransferase